LSITPTKFAGSGTGSYPGTQPDAACDPPRDGALGDETAAETGTTTRAARPRGNSFFSMEISFL